jgi:hypothetical protein
MGHEQYMGRDQYYALIGYLIMIIIIIWMAVNDKDIISLKLKKFLNYNGIILLLIVMFIVHWLFYNNVSYKISFVLVIYAFISNQFYEDYYLGDSSNHKIIRWVLFIPVSIIIFGFIFFVPYYFIYHKSLDYNWWQLILESILPVLLLYLILTQVIGFILNLCPNKIIASISIGLLSILMILFRIISVFGYVKYPDGEYSNYNHKNISNSIVVISYYALLLIFIIYRSIQSVYEDRNLYPYEIDWKNVPDKYISQLRGWVAYQPKINPKYVTYFNDGKGAHKGRCYLTYKYANKIMRHNPLALMLIKDEIDVMTKSVNTLD